MTGINKVANGTEAALNAVGCIPVVSIVTGALRTVAGLVATVVGGIFALIGLVATLVSKKNFGVKLTNLGVAMTMHGLGNFGRGIAEALCGQYILPSIGFIFFHANRAQSEGLHKFTQIFKPCFVDYTECPIEWRVPQSYQIA